MTPEEKADLEAIRPKRSVAPWILFLLTLIGLLGALVYGKGLLEAEQARERATHQKADEALAQLAAAKKEAADAAEKAAALEATRTGLEQRLEALAAEKAELSKDLATAEAELTRLKATYDSIEQKLAAEIKKGEIRLTNAEGKIRVDLVDKVLFDSGKADISPRGEEVLTRLGAVLATVDDKTIQVSGHTDDSPITLPDLKEKFPSNWELSSARAVNVTRFLTEKSGVPARRLSAAAWSQFQPVATNITPAGRAQNRRIEILLVPMVNKAPAKGLAAPVAKPAAPVKPAAKPPAPKPSGPPPPKKPGRR